MAADTKRRLAPPGLGRHHAVEGETLQGLTVRRREGVSRSHRRENHTNNPRDHQFNLAVSKFTFTNHTIQLPHFFTSTTNFLITTIPRPRLAFIEATLQLHKAVRPHQAAINLEFCRVL